MSESAPPFQSAAVKAFQPSPVPTPMEVASLAATLLIGMKPSSSSMEAVQRAGDLWAAALEEIERLTTDHGRALEKARLSHAADKRLAADRWHTWMNASNPVWDKAQYEADRAEKKWKKQAATVFQGLTWPMPFDDVMRRIMDGCLGDGKEAKRHGDYAAVWLADAQRNIVESVEGQFSRSYPEEKGSAYEASIERKKQLEEQGENPEDWNFSANAGLSPKEMRERVANRLSDLRSEWQAHKDEELARRHKGN